MAITFISIPKQWSPSDNPLSYVFSSNQAFQANFSFVVETYLDNQIISTDRLYPIGIGSSGRAQFDISPFIKNRINGATLTNDLFKDSQTWGKIKIKVTESYGAGPSLQASLFSSETFAFKCSLPVKEWEGVNFNTQYLRLKWLTKEPNQISNILMTQDVPLSMLIGTVLAAPTCTIRIYDINSVLLDTEVTNNLAEIEIVQFNLSVANLLVLFGYANFNNVYSFQIQILDEIYQFNYIKYPCYQPVIMYWLNEFGVFDSFMITHNEIKKHTIESFEYKRQHGEWVGLDFNFDSTLSGNRVYSKNIQPKGTLVTGYLTQALQIWLITSYYSPKVLLGGLALLDFRAITITNTASEDGQSRFEELIKEEIQYVDNNSFKSIKV